MLAFLKTTANHGLHFNYEEEFNLIGYSDADFAGDLDDRKSTTGYIFTLGGGSVAWASRKQEGVSLSTTEAELVSKVSEATRETAWIGRLLEELGTKVIPVEVRCNNQSAIRLAYNPEMHHRTKHIEVKHYYVRGAQQKGEVKIVYLEIENQLADGLTKGLHRPKLRSFGEDSE